MNTYAPAQSAPLHGSGRVAALTLLLCLCLTAAGCSHFRRHSDESTVYVNARQTYLHDRVAAVSNRVAMVSNGQKLKVIERGRRFLHVKTEKNEIGWIEERAVIDSKTADSFAQLGSDHSKDPVVARATLRDDLYMHLYPGRGSQHFFLLAGNAKVDLLQRATAERTQANGKPLPKPPVFNQVPPAGTKPATPAKPTTTTAKPTTATDKNGAQKTEAAPVPALPAAPVEPPPMEDWWLARDAQGHTGWLLANRLDVDVPDEIGLYSEGQRTVGAWVLARVFDAEATTPDHMVNEYMTVLAPPKAGLPYDFDQVRVFTWNTRRHRYETAFRLHPIQGYLPVLVTPQKSQGGTSSFSFQIAGDANLVTDHATGITRPVHPRTINFQLIDTRVLRTGPDMGPIPVQRDPAKPGTDGKKSDKKNKRK